MSDAPDKESKTEQATEKKLSDAREQGDVPVSREAATFAYLIAGLLVFSLLINGLISRLAWSLSTFLEQAGSIRLGNDADAVQILSVLGWEAAVAAAPIVLAFAAAGIGAAVLQNAPIPVLKRITPQFSRISLAKGLKRLFSATGLLEFGKTLFRFLAIAVTAVFATYLIWMEFQKSLFSDPASILIFAQKCVVVIFGFLTLASMFLLVIDAPLSHILWRRNQRMAPREIKEEHKQAEGDPHVKVRRRSIARDRARKMMISSVPKATVVIANPTHYAIALRYVRSEGGAPKVVAKGQDLIALTIRRIAEDNHIPVVEDKALARSLYSKVEVDQMIPAEFYRAVAEILIRLQARQRTRKLDA